MTNLASIVWKWVEDNTEDFYDGVEGTIAEDRWFIDANKSEIDRLIQDIAEDQYAHYSVNLPIRSNY